MKVYSNANPLRKLTVAFHLGYNVSLYWLLILTVHSGVTLQKIWYTSSLFSHLKAAQIRIVRMGVIFTVYTVIHNRSASDLMHIQRHCECSPLSSLSYSLSLPVRTMTLPRSLKDVCFCVEMKSSLEFCASQWLGSLQSSCLLCLVLQRN